MTIPYVLRTINYKAFDNRLVKANPVRLFSTPWLAGLRSLCLRMAVIDSKFSIVGCRFSVGYCSCQSQACLTTYVQILLLLPRRALVVRTRPQLVFISTKWLMIHFFVSGHESRTHSVSPAAIVVFVGVVVLLPKSGMKSSRGTDGRPGRQTIV